MYNSIPPYLLLHYWAWGHKGLRWTSTIASLVSTLVAIFIIIMIWLVLPNSYDFGKVGAQSHAPVMLAWDLLFLGAYEAAVSCQLFTVLAIWNCLQSSLVLLEFF